MDKLNFHQLRDKWALKATVTEEDIRYQQQMDAQANPHNEPYHNKKPRRDRAAIISDLSYTFADRALKAQYRSVYDEWLQHNCEEVWGVMRYKERLLWTMSQCD